MILTGTGWRDGTQLTVGSGIKKDNFILYLSDIGLRISDLHVVKVVSTRTRLNTNSFVSK